MHSCLPIGNSCGIDKERNLQVRRTLDTDSTAIFMPFNTRDYLHEGGVYFGQNKLSRSVVLFDRMQLNNPNSFIFGMPGSGKSMMAKLMILYIYLSQNDEILIVDTEREYAALVELLGGEVIYMSENSGTHINPLDLTENPDTDSSENASDRHKRHKAYGTTLIAFALTDTFAIGIQIGDGKAVVFDSDMKPSVPIPDDESCQMNITTSLCDDDAIDEFRHVIYQQEQSVPIAFFCGSDGIDDSYVSEEDLFSFYHGILSLFAEYGSDIAKKEIEEYLPVLTQKGSGDDVSVALIVNMPMIKKAVARYAADAEQIQTNDISEMSTIETENANPSE